MIRPGNARALIGFGGAIALLTFAACPGTALQAIAEQSAGPQASPSKHASGVQRLPGHPVQVGQQTFSSSAEATQVLVTAIQNDDRPSLLRVLGPNAKDIVSSGDETEDKNAREQFVQKYRQMHRLVAEPDGTTTLYIGAENWPTPIPLIKKDGVWYFDTAAGKQEILYRRVGENELTVIQVCHELVDAQKEYYAQSGNSGKQYAQKILSDPDKHNGLYWKTIDGEADSPLGPFIASAEHEGYPEDATQQSQSFHGYLFRILKGRGANTSGSARSYVIDGKMTGGFAFLAYPAQYRSSGVMTFLVGQDGIVYQKDLGRKTDEIVKTLTRYDRDSTWQKAER